MAVWQIVSVNFIEMTCYSPQSAKKADDKIMSAKFKKIIKKK